MQKTFLLFIFENGARDFFLFVCQSQWVEKEDRQLHHCRQISREGIPRYFHAIRVSDFDRIHFFLPNDFQEISPDLFFFFVPFNFHVVTSAIGVR